MARRAATIVLRDYQRRIAASMAQQNTVVMLPTGSGKTLVAAEAMRQVGGRALFFVPTVLLVGQQATELRDYFTGLGESLRVGEFKGGSAFPSGDWSILVTTPDAFRMEQRSNPELAWNTIQMCVFDEVHHVLKDHPYRKLALSLRKIDEKEAPRVGGLTASLTYAVTETGVNKNFDDICQELRVTNMETVEPGELVASGYHSKSADADVAAPLAPRDDVLPEKDRVAHLMGPTYVSTTRFTTRRRRASQHAINPPTDTPPPLIPSSHSLTTTYLSQILSTRTSYSVRSDRSESTDVQVRTSNGSQVEGG